MNQNKVVSVSLASVKLMRGERGRCTGTHTPPPCFSGGKENKLSHSLPICHAHQGITASLWHTQTNTHTPPGQTSTHIHQTDKYVQTYTCTQANTNTESKIIWIHTKIISELCWHLSPTREQRGMRKAARANRVGWSQRSNYFDSPTVCLTTWLGNPSARFWTAPALNPNFNLGELNFSNGHPSPACWGLTGRSTLYER